MIKSITITNHLNESIKIEMGFPEKSGFLILGLDGLGPAKATINSTDLATMDGGLFNSSRLSQRNIVMAFAFLFKNTIEEVRLASYRYFPVKRKIKFEIETEARKCEIYGYIESNEPNIFQPQVTASISMICPDPYFYSKDKVSTLFSGETALFTFPFSNESTSSKLLKMGEIINKVEDTVLYTGDVDVGVVITLNIIGAVVDPAIYNVTTGDTMAINSVRLMALAGGIGLQAEDEIVITTIKGSKSIVLNRGGIEINILNALDKDSDWFQLSRGDNVFRYSAVSGEENIQFRLDHRVLYDGV